MIKKTKLYLICLLILSLIFSSYAFAQEKTKKSGGGRGYSIMGLSVLNIDDLNSRLKSAGYPEFSNNFFSIGGGGHGIINKLIIGGQGGALLVGEETTKLGKDIFNSTLVGGYGFFDIGYIALSKKGFNIYPMLGVGFGGLTFKIAEDSSPKFDNLLSDPQRSVELNYGGLLLNVSLGVDYLIKFAEDKTGTGGLIVGLQAGYMLAPFTHDWKMDENDVTGGPDIGFNGPYIKFLFGGGGMSYY
ncbi:hypothetical protein H8E88_02210 [candidate division KSB1 bacterium]|nr:hypothetical protein [candidate division KSB1 bacterium]